MQSFCCRPRSCARADVSSTASWSYNGWLKDLFGLGAPALAPCHLAKPKRSRSTPQLVSTRGELYSNIATIRCLGTMWNAEIRIRTSCSTLRFGNKNRRQRSRKIRPTRRWRTSSRFFAYFGTSVPSIGSIAAQRRTVCESQRFSFEIVICEFSRLKTREHRVGRLRSILPG